MSERDLGRFEGDLFALKERHKDLEEKMEERLTRIEGYIQEIRDAANMGKGMWWLSLKLGAMLVTVTLSAAWVWEKSKSILGVKLP